MPASIINIGNNGTINMIYKFWPHNDSLTGNPTHIIWPGDQLEPPGDGVSLLAGDVLSRSLDGSLVVLSFAVGGVACWATMIMVEQLMYNATKRMSWQPWAIACAILHGGGVWAVHIVGLGAARWTNAPVAITYRVDYAIAGLGVSIAISLVVFLLSLIGWRVYRRMGSSDGSIPSGNSDSPQRPLPAIVKSAGSVPVSGQQDDDGKETGGGASSNDAARSQGGTPLPTVRFGAAPGVGGARGPVSVRPLRVKPYESNDGKDALYGSGTGGATGRPASNQLAYRMVGGGENASTNPLSSDGAASPRNEKSLNLSTTGSSESSDDEGADGLGAWCLCDSTKRSKRALKYKYDPSIRAQLLLSMYRINIFFVVAACVAACGNQAVHELLRLSLPRTLGPSISVSKAFYALFIAAILYLPSLLIVFFFFPASSIRFVGKSPACPFFAN
jgi:hypothetical protein